MFGVDELEKLRKEGEVIKAAPISFVIVCLVATGLIWTFFHFTYSERIEGADGRLKNAQDDATHWHQTADYYKDLASRPVQHETTPAISQAAPVKPNASTDKPGPARSPELTTKHHEGKPNNSSSNEKPPDTSKPPAITAPNGVAIGRDNNGTAVVNNIGALARTVSSAQQAEIISHLGSQPAGFTGITCFLGDPESCGFATQLMEALRNAGWKIDGLTQAVFSNPLEGTFVTVAPEDSAAPPEGVLRMYNTLRSAGVPIQGLRMNGTPVGKFGIVVGSHTKPG